MDDRERYDDPEEALRAAFHGLKAGIWTALPGIIQSFNAAKNTVVVQPAIQANITDKTGATTSVNLPLLPDVPVFFPRGGGCTLTFPIKAGDECLVVFSARCIDAWWQQGGVQPQYEPRMMDLSDGIAFVGLFSQKTVIANISTTVTQLRTDDGQAYVQINPATHQIDAITPGLIGAHAGTDIVATAGGKIAAAAGGNIEANAGGDATVTAAGNISLTAPNISLNGNIALNGPITQGTGAGGTAASLIGPLSVSNEVTGNGKVLSTHTHSGVQPGGGNSGPPT